MLRFRSDLQNKLQDKTFAEGFRNELQAARIAIEIAQAREQQGLSQSDLASKAHITQQLLSKVENARACKVETLIKVADALGLELTLKPKKSGRRRLELPQRRTLRGNPKKP